MNQIEPITRKEALRGLLWPSLLTLAGLAILIGLGTWQLNRKGEKDALIAQLEARAQAAPTSLDDAIARWREGDAEYLRVTVRGVLDHSKERYLYAPHQRYGTGYDVFVPLLVEGDGRYLWVNIGYVPEQLKDPSSRPAGAGDEAVELIGRVRLSAKSGTFTPDNDVARNQWYWRDLGGMHASAFDPGQAGLIPFFLEVESGANDKNADEWPKPGASKVTIVNRHFEYALTWYGLALTLIGVYVAFAVGRLTNRRDPE